MRGIARAVLQSLFLANLALTLALLGYHLRVTYGPAANAKPVSLAPATPKFPSLTVAEAAKHLVANDAVFVDARQPASYKAGSIPTALSLPAGQDITAYDVQRLRPAALLIVYCDGPTCDAAEEVAAALWAKGLTKVAVLQEGWQGWTEAGMPAVKASGQTPP